MKQLFVDELKSSVDKYQLEDVLRQRYPSAMVMRTGERLFVDVDLPSETTAEDLAADLTQTAAGLAVAFRPDGAARVVGDIAGPINVFADPPPVAVWICPDGHGEVEGDPERPWGDRACTCGRLFVLKP